MLCSCGGAGTSAPRRRSASGSRWSRRTARRPRSASWPGAATPAGPPRPPRWSPTRCPDWPHVRGGRCARASEGLDWMGSGHAWCFCTGPQEVQVSDLTCQTPVRRHPLFIWRVCWRVCWLLQRETKQWSCGLQKWRASKCRRYSRRVLKAERGLCTGAGRRPRGAGRRAAGGRGRAERRRGRGGRGRAGAQGAVLGVGSLTLSAAGPSVAEPLVMECALRLPGS
jgi:hypothetical protein